MKRHPGRWAAAFSPFLSQANRPIRLRLSGRNEWLGGELLVQRIDIREALFEGITAHITCLASDAGLAIEQLLGLAVEIQLVTDRGDLRTICAVIHEARAGQSDGGLAVYQLTGRDILALMQERIGTRVFMQRSVVDITRIVLEQWSHSSSPMAHVFDFTLSKLDLSRYPPRAFTFQHNESDSAFLKRLWRQAGISWFFCPEPPSRPDLVRRQQLVLFDDGMKLAASVTGPIRYHRDAPTEERDTIQLWAPARKLVAGTSRRSSWDYKGPGMADAGKSAIIDQGDTGTALSVSLRDTRILPPHAGDDYADHAGMTRRAQLRHEFEAACIHGAGCVRDLAAGEWALVTGHPRLEGLRLEQREFTFIEVRHEAENNLPKELNERAQALLAASDGLPGWRAAASRPFKDEERRYRNHFIAVPRDAPIVPAWNPDLDFPPMHPISAIVVGPPGEEVHCDERGRFKLQFQGLDPADHGGDAGTSGSDRDSAWVRCVVASAGEGFGEFHPPRAGMEARVEFEGGDPSRPVITGFVYNGGHPPPGFSNVGSLPGNRYLSGTKTREVFGSRYGQTRYDVTPGEISVQVASEHDHSQLNLGCNTHPRRDGQGRPRGEGAELRTDGVAVARGGRGVFLDAHAQPQAGGSLLDRGPLVGLVQALRGIEEQLGELAARHLAEGTDVARFAQLVDKLENWDGGSRTAPLTKGGGAGIVAASAPQGIALASHDNLVLGAQTHIDAVSVGNTQLSAGRRLLLRCAEMLSAFAAKGMKLIAADGALQMQAQKESIELTAAKRIVLTAGTEIVLQAPVVRHVAQGAQIELGNGGITQQSSGGHVIKSTRFDHVGPGDGVPAAVALPVSDMPHDQQVVLRWFGTHEPMRNQRYRITTETGQVIEGCTDASGLTERFPSSTAFGNYSIEPLDAPTGL